MIDPRTLVPLDLDTIVESVRRTNRLVSPTRLSSTAASGRR